MSEQSPTIETPSPATTDAESTGWPFARLARPAVIAGEHGAVDASPIAAIDYAVVACRAALASILGRPVHLKLAAEADPAPAAPQGLGIALTANGGIEALLMLDPRAARLLANAAAIDQGGSPSSTAPGPVAELSDAEKGLIEYLTLVVLDRLLQSAHIATHGPAITAFCDSAAAGVWLQKHQARAFAFEMTMTGSSGGVRLHLTGMSEVQAAALVGCLSMLDMSAAGLGEVNISLALPAIALQPEELAGMQQGDVLLLGAPALTAMPLAGELVTSTHWSLGKAVVTHDTPTYLSITFTPALPAPRAAALQTRAAEPVVQPVIGLANETIDRLRSLGNGETLHLAKDPVTPVALYHGPRKIAEGELIVLGSELGLRLVAMTAVPT